MKEEKEKDNEEMKEEDVAKVLDNQLSPITCKFKDEYNRYKMFSLQNEIEKAYIEEGKILEKARHTKCNRFIANHYINKNKRKKYTLFNLTHLLKTCINYHVDSPLTYFFICTMNIVLI